jgi:hypothetical protein
MNQDINNLKKLLEIIPKNHPALRVAHFSDRETILIKLLEDIASMYDIEYQLNITDTSLYNEISNTIAQDTKIIKFNLNRPKYMIQGKLYDFVFVTNEIENLDEFLQKVHPIIKNAGNIIFLLPKDSDTKVYEELLEKNYFVATSIMDDLMQNEIVLISRKMHGWGG